MFATRIMYPNRAARTISQSRFGLQRNCTLSRHALFEADYRFSTLSSDKHAGTPLVEGNSYTAER